MSEAFDEVETLVRTLVEQVVDNPDEVKITATPQSSQEIYVEVSVAEDDIGKVIGRQGRIIKSIRTLARAAGSQDGIRVEVEIA